MNKAVVSKSVNTLIARELIVPADGARGSRPLYLTRAGADMHDRMKPISLEGQEIVLADLSPDEVRSSTVCSRGSCRRPPTSPVPRTPLTGSTGADSRRRKAMSLLDPDMPIDIPYVHR